MFSNIMPLCGNSGIFMLISNFLSEVTMKLLMP